jgi:regulator of nonsense transcripts 3
MTQSSMAKEAGIIQLPLSATQKGAPAKRAPKVAAPRLKLIVRRLPPGLTRAEFETGLGDEWKVGRGKIDWFQFKPGKISKECALPSYLTIYCVIRS